MATIAQMAEEARSPDPRTPPVPPDPKRGNLRVSGAREKPPMLPWSPRRFLIILAVLFLLNWAIVAIFAPAEPRISVPYNPNFLEEVRDGNVKEISSTGEEVKGEFKREVKFEGDTAKNFETQVPTFANERQLSNLLEDQDVQVNASPPGERSLLETLLFSFGPTILLVALFIWFFRRAAAGAGGGGVLGQFGRSRARRVEPSTQTVTFEDVAGIDEAEDELVEVVDFLRNPDKYRQLGARIPRGVLLAGPPGTGKTLLARAVAGEASVPFFSSSASEFIEAIVGIGASRVRDLFQQAKESAPAIVFIDELDAIGRARGGGAGLGGHDEREQTLNQILTEMDGFDSSVGVIVLGATNRADVLDPALLRPGRFDRRVAVQAPDGQGREMILRVHTRSVPLADDVDLAQIAQSTPGMVGADLANLVNEAALLAARRGHQLRAAFRLHRRARANPARRRAKDHSDRRRIAAGSPTTRAATRSSACSRPGPTRSARCRSSRAGRRSASRSPPPKTTASTTPKRNCGRRSASRSGDEWRRKSSTGSPPRAPNRTSSRSR